MGWASGSEILDDVAKVVMPLIPAARRAKVAEKLIGIFDGHDCDTINEVTQKDVAKAYEAMYPEDDDTDE